MMRSSAIYGLAIIAILVLHGCSLPALTPVSPERAPQFYDDGDLSVLRKSLQQTLLRLNSKPPATPISFGTRTYSVHRLQASIGYLLDLLADNPDHLTLDTRLKASFELHQSTGFNFFTGDKSILVTGYYQPVFKGNLTRMSDYRYPLYTVPSRLLPGSSLTLGAEKHGSPKWNRRAIETRGLCAGNELIWLRDPMDAYVLHIQGSGLVRLPDGSLRSVGYAGTNGYPYRSIGYHMATTGRLKSNEVSLASIRQYMSAHPQERDEILFHNESYIFFQWNKTMTAKGALGVDLTSGRSIATDFSCVPAGGIAFLKTSRPIMEKGTVKGWESVSRIVVAQDTGSAIKGPGRVDLFCGTGEQAGEIAGYMKQEGQLYVMVLKDEPYARYREAVTL